MTAKFDIVQETNHFPIMRGWVFQDCWVRVAGRTELWSIPLRPLGSAA